MRAWVLGGPGELELTQKPLPVPKRAEVLVRIDAVWACPARGAARWRPLLEQVDAGRHAPDPFGDDRLLRTRARPARASA